MRAKLAVYGDVKGLRVLEIGAGTGAPITGHENDRFRLVLLCLEIEWSIWCKLGGISDQYQAILP